jgi:hypothetical protein
MSERITQKHLDAQLAALNRTLNRPEATYKQDAAGRYRAQVGNIHLDHSNGGWMIEEICSDGGGITHPFGDRRMSASECWTVLYALNRLARQLKEETLEPVSGD